MGRDVIKKFMLHLDKCFNPRARVGRDGPAGANSKGNKSFNPRARVGRDKTETEKQIENVVSIHAPAWGATQYNKMEGLKMEFQSTRPRGARPCY